MRTRDFAERVSRLAIVLAAAVAVGAGAWSCTENTDGPETPAKKLSITTADGSSSSGGTIWVAYNAEKTSLSILARSSWVLTIDGGPDWITPSRTSGSVSSSSVTVDFKLTPNEGEQVRNATVTIQATDETAPYVFTISQNPHYVLTGVNKWIYEEMSKFYYFNSAIPTVAPPDNSLAYDGFLQSLILSLPWGTAVQDSSDGETPPTIDGHWNKADADRPANVVRDGIYSYIDKVSGPTRAGGVTEQTFGMGVRPVIVDMRDGSVRNIFVVLWVREDGPAARMGLKRGSWIVKNNGGNFTDDSFYNVYVQIVTGTGSPVDISIEEPSLNLDQALQAAGKRITLAPESMPVQPILLTKTLTTGGGKKVAYMVYNSFEVDVNTSATTIDEWFRNDSFLKDMRAQFARFKADGPTEMVLDLRYNPGGYVDACRVLTSLVSGAGADKVFAKLKRNGDYTRYYPGNANPEVVPFRNETDALGLKRLYVLATDGSASASEMVINALRGIGVDVVVIGKQTNGKNVGMDIMEFKDNSGTYRMSPITFKVLNAENFCNYAGGFPPTPGGEFDEFEGVRNRKQLLDLGNQNEMLLHAALTHIDTGSFPAAATRSAVARSDFKTMPTIPGPRGGARYIPDTAKTRRPDTNR